MNQNNILITTPIYYVNSSPHIGHAYTNLIASLIKKWSSIKNDPYKKNNIMLLTGTDEHGQKIEESAKKQSTNIKDFIDKYSLEFKNLAIKMNIEFDDFIRTSEERHKKCVVKIWNDLYQKGYIYFGKYSGWYAQADESFYKDSEVLNGKSLVTGADVYFKEEDAYFFKLSIFEEKLLNFFEKNKNFIIPNNRSNQIIAFIKSGLQDLCISRKNFNHGIKVPNDETQTIYVWIDALVNYISAIEYFYLNDKNINQDNIKFFKFWPQKNNTHKNDVIHIVGKDISRFHAVYWIAMLFALDIEPPTNLVVHGWWLNNGEKISKSLGNIIDPNNIIDIFGMDYFSYFFLSEIGLDSDGNYSETKFVNKINSELVNNIGNLISRVTNMSDIYFNGDIKNDKLYQDVYKDKIDKFIIKFSNFMNEYKFNLAIQEILSFSSEINLLIDEYKPWKKLGDKDPKENERDQIESVFFVCLKVILIIISCLFPFIPQKSKEILLIFFEMKDDEDFDSYDLIQKSYNFNNFKKIKKINVFARINLK
jgi:methionyl-tRNA synthetase